MLRYRERSRDLRVVARLDSLRADLIFGWRQLVKKPTISLAAILSLGLSIGACTAAFRLIDALLLRPLPVAHADRLFTLVMHGPSPTGKITDNESNEYPQFALMRQAVKEDADLIAVSLGERVDLTFSSDAEMEKAQLQYVSGWMFSDFGLQPAAGRLLNEGDDLTPKARPYAVLSYDYWARRFGSDPKVVGQTFHQGNDLYQIVGVAPQGFTGTEPGVFTDIFAPTMMHAGVTHDDWGWIRTYIQLNAEGNLARVRDRLQAVWRAVQGERAKAFTDWPKDGIQKYLQETAVLEPAASGTSSLREDYQLPLLAIGVIVALVLLIACANVANLLTAQAAARSREMALRVSLGAGRGRLTQMVLVESALLAAMATVIGILFAWWSAPFIVSRINPPDNPAQLVLPADWRVAAFAVGLSVVVTILFGLIRALRASMVQPQSALKGGDAPHARRRLMYALIAAQVAFCFVVHLGAGAFVSTLHRLAKLPTGFSAARVLDLETVTKPPQPTEVWFQLADHLRALSGVESVAMAGWPLLSDGASNGFVSVHGARFSPVLCYFLNVSPNWLETMKMPLLAGRDLRPDERSPGAAIVNETFAKEYFGHENPLGQSFLRGKQEFRIVGLTRDALYRSMREPIQPTAYIPVRYPAPESLSSATFVVRTQSQNSKALAPLLRSEITRARSEFRISNIRTQTEIDDAQTVRERLLAALALFFAGVALLLAAVGLYGVLDYSVLQRRREFGIRIAVGAPARDIAWRVTTSIFSMVALGTALGGGGGLLLQPYIKSLLYDVRRSDLAILVVPVLTIILATVLAALPAVVRAIRIDSVEMLRRE